MFVHTQGSVKPWQIVLLSLPPWLRYKPKYMFCFAIIPNEIKMQAAKKYYDFAAQYEMNALHVTGICGVRVVITAQVWTARGAGSF